MSKATTETLSFSIPVTNDYKAAFDVLKLVNKERAAQGKNELKMDKDLMEAAMVRSAEIVADFSHTRPDGTSCFTAVTKSVGWEGENIAVAYATPTDVMKGWIL